MDELIKIICPNCSATLSVKPVLDIEKKSVTCPVCKRKSPFVEYRRPYYEGVDAPSVSNSGGRVGWAPDTGTRYSEGSGNDAIGQLLVVRSGIIYPLQQGRNVIGRKAETSKATVQIATGDNRRVSREHLVINVQRVVGQGFVHTVSLYKENVNKTYVNGTQLLPGEELPLKHGYSIELPDLMLRFELNNSADKDKTEYK